MEERTATLTCERNLPKPPRPLLWSPLTDTFYPLPKKSFLLGKSGKCHIVVSHPTVSRVHLKGQFDGHTLEFEDQQSRNGAFVSGHRMQKFQVSLGSTFTVGSVPLVFVPQRYGLPNEGEIITRDPHFQRILADIGQMARNNLSILLNGETGTGKELVAAHIHQRSLSSRGPFVSINCGAIPKNLMESELFGHVKGAFTGASVARSGVVHRARGGTLFLDEIAELRGDHQSALLRFLESGEYRAVGSDEVQRAKVRIVTATHKDLHEEVTAGRFRKDLLYRLSQIRFKLPALRDRPLDIPLLLQKFGAPEVPIDILSVLLGYRFEGNVRELKSLARVAQSFGWTKTRNYHLTAWLDNPARDFKSYGTLFDSIQGEVMQKVVEQRGGNVSAAARQLGIPRTTLINKLKRMGLK